jgi:hypothetical protein
MVLAVSHRSRVASAASHACPVETSLSSGSGSGRRSAGQERTRLASDGDARDWPVARAGSAARPRAHAMRAGEHANKKMKGPGGQDSGHAMRAGRWKRRSRRKRGEVMGGRAAAHGADPQIII